MKSPTSRVAGLQSCDHFRWFQPPAAHVTCSFGDIEADILTQNSTAPAIGQMGHYTGIPRNCLSIHLHYSLLGRLE